MFLRLRKFRNQSYLRLDTTFTAEHILIQAGGVAPEIALVINDLVTSVIKPIQHSTEVKVGYTRYGVVAAFTSSCYDESHNQELLSWR